MSTPVAMTVATAVAMAAMAMAKIRVID